MVLVIDPLEKWRAASEVARPAADDGRIDYGRPVLDGVMRYMSPSAIDKADHQAYGGCLRRWFFRYVERRPEPQFQAQITGIQGHAEIAHYLTTGADVLGPIARTGLHAIPRPGPDLIVETAIAPSPDLSTAVLTSAGVPIIGYLDLAHARGVNAGAGDIEDTHDPDGTIEVLDWKFTGDLKNAKSRDAVRSATPMLAYAEALVRGTFPDARFVRLSHVYFQTRGRVPARKVTIRVGREEIADRWEHVAPVVRSVIEAARATRADEVPANTTSCKSYGKDCPHRTYCKAGQHNSLATFLGTTNSTALLAQTEQKMGLLDRFNLGGMTAAPAITPLAPAEGVGVAVDMTAQIAVLAAAEEAATTAAAIPNGFAKAWQSIVDSGRGRPTLTGAVANAYSACKGLKGPDGKRLIGVTHSGEGMLKDLVLDDAVTFFAAAGEIGALPPMPAGLLPPDAPVSNPAATAPPPNPAPAAVTPATAPPPTPAPEATAAAEPAKKTRKPRAAKGAVTPQADGDATAAIGDALELYVDCIPSTGFEQLAPYIGEWCEILERHFEVGDIRAADSSSPLGYSKWKGVLGALVRESAAKIPPGAYYVDTRGSEIAEVVVEALRAHCTTSGGMTVRGVR